MWVSRVRVTGGFLEGLDLQLTRGLNVVVGPRGSGKTTLLELIRHAVGAQHADATREKERQSFLKAVLVDGEVILDIETSDGGWHVVVDAKGGGQRSELERSVLVLGQNELEEIASDAPSRLVLLDLRTQHHEELPSLAKAAELTREIWAIRQEISERRDQAEKRSILVADHELLRSQESALVGAQDENLRLRRTLLADIEDRLVQSGQQMAELAELDLEVQREAAAREKSASTLRSLVSRARLLAMPEAAPEQANASLVAQLEQAFTAVESSGARLLAARGVISVLNSVASAANLSAREAAAPLRDELEKTEAGLGRVTSQLRNINVELRALDENDLRIEELQRRSRELSDTRDSLFCEYETAEEKLFRARAQIASETSSQVANNVVIAVDHLSDSTAFRDALQRLLKGSNVRSNLVDLVAERVLPKQLLGLVEAGDAEQLAVVAGTATDRAQRVVDYLDAADSLAELATIGVADSVDFRLRDGAVDKGVDELSTGQKCAVTLPIILSERKRTLILDQPEDHLDNRFLVTNIITGLNNRRTDGAQTIVATHNANVPVLGSADEVVVLRSDGRTGSVDVRGRFDEPEVVDRITRFMEGGREAFTLRSEFYEKYGSDADK